MALLRARGLLPLRRGISQGCVGVAADGGGQVLGLGLFCPESSVLLVFGCR